MSAKSIYRKARHATDVVRKLMTTSIDFFPSTLSVFSASGRTLCRIILISRDGKTNKYLTIKKACPPSLTFTMRMKIIRTGWLGRTERSRITMKFTYKTGLAPPWKNTNSSASQKGLQRQYSIIIRRLIATVIECALTVIECALTQWAWATTNASRAMN